MKLEIRKTGGPECAVCGATELVYSGGRPVAADLTRVLEREIIRREVGMAKLLRDHLEAVAADQETREERLAREVADEKWQMTLEHQQAIDAAAKYLEAAKVDVSKWRVFRRRREQMFAARIDGAITELVGMTRYGSD